MNDGELILFPRFQINPVFYLLTKDFPPQCHLALLFSQRPTGVTNISIFNHRNQEFSGDPELFLRRSTGKVSVLGTPFLLLILI